MKPAADGTAGVVVRACLCVDELPPPGYQLAELPTKCLNDSSMAIGGDRPTSAWRGWRYKGSRPQALVDPVANLGFCEGRRRLKDVLFGNGEAFFGQRWRGSSEKKTANHLPTNYRVWVIYFRVKTDIFCFQGTSAISALDALRRCVLQYVHFTYLIASPARSSYPLKPPG